MGIETFPTAPRAHRNSRVLAAKSQLLTAPHMAELTAFARRIAAERDADVPLFDPASGGVESTVLLLLESPGPASAGTNSGSGLISLDNNDQTAANGFTAMAEAELARKHCINWNVVPWYLSNRTPTREEIHSALPYLTQLLALLPDLRAVVLLGAKAQEGWRLAAHDRPLAVFPAPHPSPLAINRNRQVQWPRLVEAFRQAARVVSAP
jgi:hypothetical protein